MMDLASFSLRPGGGANPFSAFALGSRPSKSGSSSAKEDKGYDEVVKYDRSFLLAFQEVRRRRRAAAGCQLPTAWRGSRAAPQRCTGVPEELETTGADVLLGSGDNEFVSPEERYEL
jgi:hypothetical protein